MFFERQCWLSTFTVTTFWWLLFTFSSADAYSCHSKRVERSVTTTVGDTINIHNCTFLALVTITRPARVTIDGPSNTFIGRLTITGGEDETTATSEALMKPIHIENTISESILTISSILVKSPEASINIRRCTLYQLVVQDVGISSGGMLSVEHSTMTERGVSLVRVGVDGATSAIRFYASTILFRGTVVNQKDVAFFVRDANFNNQAQLVFEETALQSTGTGINLWAQTNGTDGYFYFKMFRNGAICNFTSAIISANGFALRSYTGWSSQGLQRLRYGRFANGAKMIATNSTFLGTVELYLMEGATAELDAVSYEAVDLTIHGDNEEQVVIPVPHTISVKRLSLSNCRVHLPDLNIPTPLQNTWDVRVTHQFKVHDMQLTNGQHLLLQPGPVMNSGGAAVMLTKVSLSNSSSVVTRLPVSTLGVSGFLNESSVFTVQQCLISSSTTLNRLLVDRSSFVVFNHSLLKSMALTSSFVQGQLTFNYSNVSDGFSLTNSQFLPESSISLRGAWIESQVDSRAALVVSSSFFVAATLCISGCNIIGFRRGRAIEFSSNRYEDHLFFNGSKILFSNTIVGLESGTSKYIVSNKFIAQPYRWGVLGGMGDRGSNGTTIVFHNCSFRNGKTQLYLVGNGTDVILDSATLESSEMELETDLTSSSAPHEVAHRLDGVSFFLPEKFTSNSLSLTGGIVKWMPRAAEDLLMSLMLPEDLTTFIPLPPDAPVPTVLSIGVTSSLNLKQPLTLELFRGEELAVRAADDGTQQQIVLEPSLLTNKSRVLVEDFPAGSSIEVDVQSPITSTSQIRVENVSVSSQLIIIARELKNDSSIAVQDVRANQYISMQKLQCVGCHVVIKNVSISKRGLQFSSCKFSDKGVLSISDSELNATTSTSALELASVVFASEGTLFRVADSKITNTYSSGVGVQWSRYSTVLSGALVSLTGLAITSNYQALTMYNHPGSTFFNSSILLEKTQIIKSTGRYSGQLKATLKGAIFVIGSDVSGAGDVLLTEVAGFPSQLLCASGSSAMCSGVTSSDDLEVKTGAAAVTTITNTINTATTAAMSKAAGLLTQESVSDSSDLSAVTTRVAFFDNIVKRLAYSSCPPAMALGWSSGVPDDDSPITWAPPATPEPPTPEPPLPPDTSDVPAPSDNTASSGTPLTSSAETSSPPPETNDSTPPPTTLPDTELPATTGETTNATAVATNTATTAPAGTEDSTTTQPVESTVPNTDVPSSSSPITSEPLELPNATLTEPPTETLPPLPTDVPEATSNTTEPAPRDDDATDTERQTVAATATAATTVGAAASAGGGGAAADLQTLMVLGFTTCASGTMRSVAQASRRTLYPLGDLLGDFEGTLLLGSFLLIAIFVILHVIGLLCYSHNMKISIRRAASTVKFPSFSLIFLNLLYQGIALEASLILFRKTDDNPRGFKATALATISLMGCVLLPVVYCKWCRVNIPTFMFHHYDHSCRNRFMALFVYPTGEWDPHSIRVNMYRHLCGMLNDQKWWMFACSFQVRSLLVALIAANQFIGCQTQAVMLCLIFFIHAASLVVCRPLRIRAANVFSPISSVLSGIVAISLASETMAPMGPPLLMTTTCTAVVGAFFQVSSLIVEKMWRRRGTASYMEGECPIAKTESDSDGADEGEEMKHLMVPLKGEADANRHLEEHRSNSRGASPAWRSSSNGSSHHQTDEGGRSIATRSFGENPLLRSASEQAGSHSFSQSIGDWSTIPSGNQQQWQSFSSAQPVPPPPAAANSSFLLANLEASFGRASTASNDALDSSSSNHYTNRAPSQRSVTTTSPQLPPQQTSGAHVGESPLVYAAASPPLPPQLPATPRANNESFRNGSENISGGASSLGRTVSPSNASFRNSVLAEKYKDLL